MRIFNLYMYSLRKVMISFIYCIINFWLLYVIIMGIYMYFLKDIFEIVDNFLL